MPACFNVKRNLSKSFIKLNLNLKKKILKKRSYRESNSDYWIQSPMC